MSEKKDGLRATIKDGELVIVLPLNNPQISATKKTMVLGSSRGNIELPVKFNGAPVYAGINVYSKIKDIDAVASEAAGKLPQDVINKMKDFISFMDQHSEKEGLQTFIDGIKKVLEKL